MNIAFDMSFALTESKDREIGKAARNLINSIIRENDDHAYYYFYPEKGRSSSMHRNQLQRFLSANDVDLFHILSPFESVFPPFNQLWFGRTKVAVMLHDFIPLLFPEVYLNNSDLRSKYMDKLEFVKTCDLLLANSESTKQDAIQTAGLAAEKIKVIYGGLEKSFKIIPVEEKKVNRYGIVKPYVLCMGGLDFCKNTAMLMQAFGRANEQMNPNYQLVMVCKLNQKVKDALHEMAQKAGIAEDLVLVDEGSDRELVKLYNSAELFAYPSLYEGFGFPVLEAMACGTPVLASEHVSLSEICGDAAYLVNPNDDKDIQKGLMKCLLDANLRSDLRSKGLDQAERFDWHAAGVKTLEAYPYAWRKKLAVFAPLHPLKTGIADYMDTILPTLGEHYECDLFIDDGYKPEWPIEIEEDHNHRSFHHSDFSEKVEQYDEVLYQLGNSSNHSYMLPYLDKYPGVVVMHDVHYHQNLNQAKSIIVHNQYAKTFLNNQGYRNVAINRLPQKLPIMISLVVDRDFLFASFGYVKENKHIDLIIRSIKKLVDEGATNIHYMVVGEGQPSYMNQLKELVKTLDLEQIVEFTGYVNQTEYQKRLSQADTCVQLRYPTDGESSAALLDVLSHGKAAIVTDVDSFSELPNETVIKIAHENQEEQLFAAMQRLYRDKDLRKQMRQYARNYVAEHHDIEKYVDRIKDIIEKGVQEEEVQAQPESEPHVVIQEEVPQPVEEATQHEPEPVSTIRTILLHPNRYRRILRGKQPVSYFSFNLNQLPEGCTIQSATMQIQAVTKALRVHRIRTGWSSKSLPRRKPPIRKYPVFKQNVKKKTKKVKRTLFRWNCTRQAKSWRQDGIHNHGVYVPRVSAVKKPLLRLVVSGTF
jgi:glycosyltransferase involved in cell wall biosynthesis